MEHALEHGLEHCVVGVPENRRTTLYEDAARSLGAVSPRVVSWLDVLGGSASFLPGEMVRVDSPGEDAEVARLLRGSAGPVDMYRVEGSAAWYAGFSRALRLLDERVRRAGARLLTDIEETLVMFDKARCHKELSAAGVRVPAVVEGVDGYDSLLMALETSGRHRVFVKPRHGSSAAGVVAFSMAPQQGAVKAVSSAELSFSDSGELRLFNSLRVSTYADPARIRLLIDALAVDGLHVEAWIPKATQQGRPCDLRVVVIGGVATHAVVRVGRSPMTNLHLGGSRGDLAVLRRFLGDSRWREVLTTAEQAATVFPGSPCVGVDVLVDVTGRSWIGEVNAYGDLLPNLRGLPGTIGDGVDTYTAQLKALLAR